MPIKSHPQLLGFFKIYYIKTSRNVLHVLLFVTFFSILEHSFAPGSGLFFFSGKNNHKW